MKENDERDHLQWCNVKIYPIHLLSYVARQNQSFASGKRSRWSWRSNLRRFIEMSSLWTGMLNAGRKFGISCKISTEFFDFDVFNIFLGVSFGTHYVHNVFTS